MCISFFSFTDDPSQPFKLVLTSNRDEFYTRPTKPAHFWDDGILAGMDMEPGKSGGTWLGMTKTGRFATLTNYRQRISDVKSDVLGRGYLVVDFLRGQMSPEDYLKPLEEKRSQYNGFNILALDLRLREICYFTNMEDKEMQKLTPG
jgi:uncharacterized protein with NRDE domain